jgi:hypothetical protein
MPGRIGFSTECAPPPVLLEVPVTLTDAEPLDEIALVPLPPELANIPREPPTLPLNEERPLADETQLDPVDVTEAEPLPLPVKLIVGI